MNLTYKDKEALGDIIDNIANVFVNCKASTLTPAEMQIFFILQREHVLTVDTETLEISKS